MIIIYHVYPLSHIRRMPLFLRILSSSSQAPSSLSEVKNISVLHTNTQCIIAYHRNHYKRSTKIRFTDCGWLVCSTPSQWVNYFLCLGLVSFRLLVVPKFFKYMLLKCKINILFHLILKYISYFNLKKGNCIIPTNQPTSQSTWKLVW